jgi:hypothetical protein
MDFEKESSATHRHLDTVSTVWCSKISLDSTFHPWVTALCDAIIYGCGNFLVKIFQYKIF